MKTRTNVVFVIFLLIHISLIGFSQDADIYYEKTNNGYVILANNPEYCPVSVKLAMDLNNLSSTHGNNKIFVIPPRSQGFFISNLVAKKSNKSYKFKLATKSNFGNHLSNDYDEYFEYYLPYAKGASFQLWQGYNGRDTHKDINALDFKMDVGTEICAVRGGVVVDVIEHNYKNCNTPDCLEYNNHILIYHSDGSFASYAHIKHNGSVVEEGDFVEIGDLIGYSGNVGYSSGPHLHLEIILIKIEEVNYLETKFLVGDGSKAQFLVEKQRYNRDY